MIHVVMQGFRRQLVRLAGGWLVLQLSLVSSAPVVLCIGMSKASPNVQCACSHGDGVACPMHRATPKRDSKSCSCRSTTDDGIAVIASLVGTAAVLTTPIRMTEPSISTQAPQRSESHPLDLFLVPDAPPPRA